MVGTPTYMAPEQIISGMVDSAADVYAAGVMLFEMLVGRLPYPPYESALKLLKIKLRLQDRLFLKKPSQINPAIHDILDHIILKAIAYNKNNRYATCREFAQDIEQFMRNNQG